MSELKHTVETHPNILEVHFDVAGNHYFNIHTNNDIPFGQHIEGRPVLVSRIIETKTREEILGKARSFDTSDKKSFVDKKTNKKK